MDSQSSTRSGKEEAGGLCATLAEAQRSQQSWMPSALSENTKRLIQKLSLQYPNDMDLGKAIRKLIYILIPLMLLGCKKSEDKPKETQIVVYEMSTTDIGTDIIYRTKDGDQKTHITNLTWSQTLEMETGSTAYLSAENSEHIYISVKIGGVLAAESKGYYKQSVQAVVK